MADLHLTATGDQFNATVHATGTQPGIEELCRRLTETVLAVDPTAVVLQRIAPAEHEQEAARG